MISLILARGGSKGVPDKNIKVLGGFPLIAYPVITAKKCRFITDVYVSTDSEKISEIAKDFGAKIIDRPSELAQDNSLDVDAFRHAVGVLGYSGDILHLRATTPLSDYLIVEKGIEHYIANIQKCTSMRSGHKTSETVYKFFKKDGKFWSGLFPDMAGEYYNSGRQELPVTYKPNGYVDVVKTDVFMSGNTFHGNRILSFETPNAVEIDTVEEFEYLEYLISLQKAK
jgi:CMP-N,N'-diacetyllegionaminic acid synthase